LHRGDEHEPGDCECPDAEVAEEPATPPMPMIKTPINMAPSTRSTSLASATMYAAIAVITMAIARQRVEARNSRSRCQLNIS